MQSPSATANGTHWDLAPVARELLAQTVGREGGLATIKLTLHLKKNGCSRNNISRSASTGFTSIFFAYGFFSEYRTVNCNWNLQQHLHVVAGFWRAKKIDF